MNYERKTQGEANSGKSEHLTRLRLVGLLILRTTSHCQMLLASDLDIPPDHSRWVTDIPGTTSLLCLLPLFLELAAARAVLEDDWVPTSEWFELAGEFMLQAVIEEYLLNGSHGEEVFNAMFAVGCPGVERWAEEGSDVTAMRRLFCDENNPRQQLQNWTSIRERCITKVCIRDFTIHT
jgi:hypothetical protein